MKAGVTGATGFIGVHLVQALTRRGWEVTALVRSAEKAAARLTGPAVRTVPGDLADAAAVREVARGQDVVFHLAGLVAARTPQEFLHVNRDGSRRVAQAAAAAGARLIHVSSMAAAGPSAAGRPLAGDGPAHPVTRYGRSKLAGEAEVRGSEARWTILRPSLVYGPWDTELFKVFRMVRHGWAPLFGDGRQELSAVYGPDLAQALVVAAETDTSLGRIYYPGHPARFTTGELVRGIARAAGRDVNVVHLPRWVASAVLGLTGATARLAGRATLLTRDKANEFFQPAWTGDPAPLTADTGWVAEHDLDEGLQATLAWYRQRKWLR